MKPDAIDKVMKFRPFKPFKIHLADGKTISVIPPEFVAYTPADLIVFTEGGPQNWDFHYVNRDRITRLEIAKGVSKER